MLCCFQSPKLPLKKGDRVRFVGERTRFGGASFEYSGRGPVVGLSFHFFFFFCLLVFDYFGIFFKV
jgi:hypothetical protein